MVFSSPRFLLFLLVLLVALAAIPGNRQRKWALALASCFFYAAWDYRYLALLLVVGVLGYAGAAAIDEAGSARARRAWVTATVALHLGLLGYFKYYNFFVDNLNGVFARAGWTLPRADILLPAGISFYTFKSMSYAIDVHRGHLERCRSRLDYLTFVTFFPELIAGPIVRASVFLPQMARRIGPTVDRLAVGWSIFLVGLTKKVFVADRVAAIVDPVFAAPAQYAPGTLWLAVLAYSLQIYCDFSGYSDMAIGTAKMIGYDLPENFNMPYLSPNVTEFWRRWHITLSTWLRDYLYIPLGGNRRSSLRTYVNLMLTMLLGGLWHGASWNFVLWGGLHGVALAGHRFYQRQAGERRRLPVAVTTAATFLFVALCWIPFRASSFGVTTTMLARMFGFPSDGVLWLPTALVPCVVLVVVGHVLGVVLARTPPTEAARRLLGLVGAERRADGLSGWYVRLGWRSAAGAFLVTGWVLFLFFFSSTNTSPFIYFQF